MQLRVALALAAAVPALFAMPGIAQDSDAALAEKVITNTNPSGFQAYGFTPAPKVVKDGAVQGGTALRLPVTGSGDAWSMGVNVPLTKPVKAGDRLVLAFYARLSKPGEGSAKIAGAQIQLSAAPYTRIFGQGFDVTPEWQFLQVGGKADKDYPAGALAAAFHVNTGKHVLDLGPVAVFNMGQ
jgi:hypothetical protein